MTHEMSKVRREEIVHDPPSYLTDGVPTKQTAELDTPRRSEGKTMDDPTYDVYAPERVEDLIKRLKASLKNAEPYESCQVFAANLDAAIMVLEKHLQALKKGLL